METDPLKGLFTAGWPWGVITLSGAAVLGALGGIAQAQVSEEPNTRRDLFRAALVGCVATLASLWVKPPSPTWSLIELVGFSVATGFFGRVVLATLKARLTTAVLADQVERTTAVARDAIREAEGRPPAAGAPPAAQARDAAIERLVGRLAEATKSR